MSRVLVAAALVLVQIAVATPQAIATPAHAQIFNPPTASVDMSAYTPTSQLPAVVAANAPVRSVNGATGVVSVSVPDTSAFVTASQAASAAPVQSINGLTGAVALAIPSTVGLLSAATAASTYATPAQAAAAAPVQKVNGLTGSVTVPGSVRASCTISSFDATGTGSCTYGAFTGGTAFTVTPDCFVEMTTTATNYVYAFPVVVRGLTSSSAQVQAALKVLNISLGATTIWGPPPAGTTVTLICRGQ